MPKVGFLKLGNLGTSTVVDLLIDERADREGIEVRTIGTGSKMGAAEAAFTSKLTEYDPDLAVVISPNAALSGPKEAREQMKCKTIVISDAPAKRATKELEDAGFGYIILTGDPLIGARREFLDATEMALFNSYVLKTLSITGAIRLVQEEIDKAIDQIQIGSEIELPHIVATADEVVKRANFSNPYAMAKAIAAYNIAERVAEMNVQACFVLRERERYIMTAAAAHEAMRMASTLAEEAREIEKYDDRVSRKPHSKSGEILSKVSLTEAF
jgi:methylenetetrahydromethanopterin dehydrogenase